MGAGFPRPPPSTGGSYLRIRLPRLLAVGLALDPKSKKSNPPLAIVTIYPTRHSVSTPKTAMSDCAAGCAYSGRIPFMSILVRCPLYGFSITAINMRDSVTFLLTMLKRLSMIFTL
jgi:hypothetical protein